MNFEWDIHTLFILVTALELIRIVVFIVFGFKTTKDMIALQEKADELDEWVNDLYDMIDKLECTVETLNDRTPEVVIKIQKEDKP